MDLNQGIDITIALLDKSANTYERLYEGISDFDTANLLAQFAMSNKRDDQLVFMFPGWNMRLKKDTKLYNKAKKIAKKYRVNKV